MLKIYKEEPSRYSSELVEKPLDRLSDLAKRATGSDPAVGRELEVAMELIGEVFSVGGDEVKRMIKERMAGKGMTKEKKIVQKKEKGTDKKKDGSKKRAKKDVPLEERSDEAAQ
jgi:hypothetical protein